MHLILNKTGKGNPPLPQLQREAIEACHSVRAAVAYVSDERTLVNDCRKFDKALTLYARLDSSVPVRPDIMQKFLNWKDPRFELRLVPDIFHPKVIWWEPFGVYIGSANLSDSAWFGNFEAGIFIPESRLEDDMRDDLEVFFEAVDAASRPLTQELVDQVREFQKISPSRKADLESEKLYDEFRRTMGITEVRSVNAVTPKPRDEKARASFLHEWNETLTTLRNISNLVTLPEHRPRWVPATTPAGVQTDQFLHAYYYNQVRDGQHYPYDEFHRRNKDDISGTLQKELAWWRALPKAPGSEFEFMDEWAPFLQDRLSSDRLRKLTIEEFAEVCARIHAMRDHSLRLRLHELGIGGQDVKVKQEERVRRYGRWLYGQKNRSGQTAPELIHWVLYGGARDQVPARLFDACNDEKRKIEHLGISSLGEMVGWAMPDVYPPRNGRTSKALTALGYKVRIHSA